MRLRSISSKGAGLQMTAAQFKALTAGKISAKIAADNSVGEVRFTIWGAPVGKPRMTRRDKWAKRPAVLRYREWADKARASAPELPQAVSGVSWTAYLPIPASWSESKKEKMRGALHQQKPDRDNVDKAVLDALFAQDCGVAQGTLCKRWDDGKGPRVEVHVFSQ